MKQAENRPHKKPDTGHTLHDAVRKWVVDTPGRLWLYAVTDDKEGSRAGTNPRIH